MPSATDSWGRFSSAHTAWIMLESKLCLEYRSFVKTQVNLSTIYADTCIEIISI